MTLEVVSAKVGKKHVVFFAHGVFGEHGQHADRRARRVAQPVSHEGDQAEALGPGVIAHLGIGGDAVGDELLGLAAGNAADLVTAQRHPAVRTVGVSVASGAGQQVQALLAVPARAAFFRLRGMDATGFAEVAPPDAPDAAEVEVQEADGRLRDLLELLLQRPRREQLLLEPVHALQAFQEARLPLFGLFPLADVAGDSHEADYLPRHIVLAAVTRLAPDRGTVLAEHLQLDAPGLRMTRFAGGENVFLEALAGENRRRRGRYLLDRKAEILLRRVSQQGPHRRAHVGDLAGEIHGPNYVSHVFGEEPIALEARVQGLLGTPAVAPGLGQVPMGKGDHDDADDCHHANAEKVRLPLRQPVGEPFLRRLEAGE